MKKLFVLFLFCISLALITVNAKAELNLELPDMNIPDLGGYSGHYISAVKEGDQGLRILRSLRAQGQLIEDPEINLWIRSLGNRLTARAPNVATPFYFAVSKSGSINAFATIGGVVVVNAGLILRSDSESELAAVISHEIAHVTQRHIQRMIAKAEANKFATGAALVVGAIAATQNSEAGAAILNTTLATAAHKQLAFSRDAEAEADRVGLRILASAGFNPKAMPAFLRKLERFDDSNTADIREFLQNHPLSVKRVSDTSQRAQRFGPYKGKENPSYLYMREKIRSLTAVGTAPPNNLQANIKAYAYRQNLKQRGAYTQALQATKARQTNNVSEAILLATLYNKQKQFNKTVALLKPLLRIYPGNEALTAPIVQALLSLRQFQRAWKVLQEINVSEQTSLEIFEIKQQVAKLLGNNALAYRAVAERSLRTGRYKAAGLQLQQAIKLPGASIVEVQEMRQMLQAINRLKKPVQQR